jgi:hypothetical protein
VAAAEEQAVVELGSARFWERLQADPARLAAEVCTINTVNIIQTLHEQPALRAWVNATHEMAKIEEEQARYELTKTRARVLLAAKAEEEAPAEPGGKGKVKGKTVAVLDAEVEDHAEVQAANEKLLAVMTKRSVLRAMSDALEDRLQMLIQISAHQRAEKNEYSRQ